MDSHGQDSSRRLIIGGHNVQKHRYPYFVSLDRQNGVVVNGVLIAPTIVLTAGHVVIGGLGPITLRVGTYSIANDTEDVAETIAVQSYIRHPDWEQFVPERFSNDFCIIQLAAPSTHPFVRINRDDSVPRPERSVTLMGVGWTNETVVSPSDIVQETKVNVVSNKVCEATSDPSRGVSYEGQIDRSMLCTMEPANTTRDGCVWDSGGPVIVKGSKPKDDLLVALVSTGVACADPVFPAIQARVSEVTDWIDSTVCRLSPDPPSDFKCPPKLNHTETIAPSVFTVQPQPLPMGSPEPASPYRTVAFVGVGVFVILAFVKFLLQKGSPPPEGERLKPQNGQNYGSVIV